MYLNLFTTLLFLCLINNHCHCQDKPDAAYISQARIISKKIWADQKPEFQIRSIPSEFEKQSKVIIASHTELFSDSKPKIKFENTSPGAKNQIFNETSRYLIRLNDKNAVDEYSEFKFDLYAKNNGSNAFEKTTTYIGVRIIKTDGTVVEMDPGEILLDLNDFNYKKGKFAIPDLQPGDLIDYFFVSETQSSNDFRPRYFEIALFNSVPVMNQSFHAVLDKNYAVDHKSYNGAPELRVFKNDDNIIIDLRRNDIPAYETQLWVAPELQFPFIRLHLGLGFKGGEGRLLQAFKPGEITSGGDPVKVQLFAIDDFMFEHFPTCTAFKPQLIYFLSSNVLDRLDDKKELSTIQKAMYTFYAVRFARILNFDIEKLAEKIDIGSYEPKGLHSELYCTFKSLGGDANMIMTGYKNSYRLNEVMNTQELKQAVYIPEIKRVMTVDNPFSIPFEIPITMNGLKQSLTYKTIGMLKEKDLMEGPVIPESSANDNTHIENLSISILPDNNLDVKRKTTLKGYYKEGTQRQLITYEDYYEEERKSFGLKRSLLEKLYDSKDPKLYEEVKSAFAAARTKQKERFLEEAKEWLELDITDISEFATDTLGVRHTAPNFVYRSRFNLSGLVKKAGKNLIIDVGKLQGKPLEIKEDQRLRKLDVYMHFARSIECNIGIKIPEDYAVEGIELLNTNVSNSTGNFTVTATTSGQNINIRINKAYLHDHEKAEDWGKMLEFLDASIQWYDSKLLLRKID